MKPLRIPPPWRAICRAVFPTTWLAFPAMALGHHAPGVWGELGWALAGAFLGSAVTARLLLTRRARTDERPALWRWLTTPRRHP